ncbi:sigma-70 region 4 domain-containing protein [Sphingopyxis indica]|uniref:RNA polymerase sigma factor n=1 Tax=Sphingopyxis indica TaxID=436663 RepID=UPI002938CFAC|nr:sigma-70 region 4 domain-containing protein [Sphingopyxis indica]WOF44568.1 sigma-70 region 4 domain-containing protein [Sphingopyxis indica]
MRGRIITEAERRVLRRYERAVLRMSPRQRAVFLAHVVGGLSYRQIAHQQRISLTEVECHLWLALAVLDDERKPRYWWQFWKR